jgi:diacylglycerol kinase family enzyme
MSVVIILNPIAGGASRGGPGRRVDLARAVLARCGAAGEVWVTERRGHARELAAAAAARGARLIVAWGGDGTVNEVASALVSGSASLGIVPAGSGNGLARELGIAGRPARAVADALAATPRRIDAGELGGRLFFSVAGVGFDAHVAACFDHDGLARRGFAGYLRIVARELRRYEPATYRVTGEAPARARRAFLITFANTSGFGNGTRIAPGARVDDGRLDLVVFEETSRLRTICAIPRLFTGGAAAVRGLTIERVERAIIEGDGPLAFHVDGEPLVGGRRLEARVHPGALAVSVR